MKVTQEDIEIKVVELLTDLKYPTKIFMDTKTLEEFTKSLKPKERLQFKPQETVEVDKESKLVKFHVTGNALEFFEVLTDKDVFEVV